MIYFDNASTSFPKAVGLGDAIAEFIEKYSVNINRGSYSSAFKVEELVFDCRCKLAKLFHCTDCKNIIFTANVTLALNMVMKGFLKAGDHVLVSEVEHNAIMRPLKQLSKLGVSFSKIPCDAFGQLRIDKLEELIQKNTKALICTHASNVCCSILPIEELGKICKEKGLAFIVDAAQTAGVLDIDMQSMHISALCFTGHKALLGPQGIGGFALRDDFAGKLTPLISGGTGSFSDSEEVPELLPDKFESGTLNLPGIVGLNHALDFIASIGTDKIHAHEMALCKRFIEGLKKINGLKIIGLPGTENRTAVVSVTIFGKDLALAAFDLENKYNIQTRTGLHCAPGAHKVLGSFPEGGIRFSFSYFNTMEEIDYCLKALQEIASS